MTTSVEEILKTFDRLPDEAKREVAREIIRRSVRFDFPPITDEVLIFAAEDVFLELDREEAKNE